MSGKNCAEDKVIILFNKFYPEHPNISKLAICVELEQLGYTVHIIPSPESEINHRQQITTAERRVRLSEIKASSSEEQYQYLLGIIKKHKEIPGAKSFFIEQEGNETYLCFPAVNQDIGKIDGVMASRSKSDIEKQTQLKARNSRISCYNSTNILKIASDKICFQPALEEAEVPTPDTICLEHKEAYTLSDIQNALEEKGLCSPYVVKSAQGYGGMEVCLAETAEEVCGLINQMMQRGNSGAVIQNKIDTSEIGAEWLRVIVYAGEILGALKCTGIAGALPKEINDGPNTKLHAKKEPCTLTPEQQKVAIKAGNALGEPFVCGVDLSTTELPVVYEIGDTPDLEPHLFNGQPIAADIARIFDAQLKEKALCVANRSR